MILWITEWFVLEMTLKVIFFLPCHVQGHFLYTRLLKSPPKLAPNSFISSPPLQPSHAPHRAGQGVRPRREVGFILPTPHMIGQEGRGEGSTAPEPSSPLSLPIEFRFKYL